MRGRGISLEELSSIRRGLSKPRGATLYTNDFGGGDHLESIRCAHEDQAMAYAGVDAGLERVFFHAYDLEALRSVLDGVRSTDRQVLDLIGRSARYPDDVQAVVIASGFEPIARYIRIGGTPRRRVARKGFGIERATTQHLETIAQALHADFDVRKDHLPSRAKLGEWLKAGQIWISQSPHGLDAYAIFEEVGTKFHFHYLVNRSGDPFKLDGLMRVLHGAVAERGLTSGFAWVDEAKPGVIALHKRFGLVPDGVEDRIFERREP